MAESPTRTLGDRLADAWRAYWNPPLTTRDPALSAYFGSAPTAAGVTVNEATALNFSAVWAAVSCIAGDVASLPLFHYKRLPKGGKERMIDSRLYGVLHDAFNPEMSSFVARETMQGHVLTWGNAYAEIQRNEANQVVALWPIEPHRVTPYRETPTSALRYRVATSDGRSATVPAETILHLPGLGFDGISGYSVIAKARESLAAGLAAQSFTSAFYGNGVAFSGFFEHPKSLSETAHQHLKESIAAGHQGAAKAGGFRILEEGMTFKPGSMPLKDAEFLSTRKFQISEVARWFGVPPHKLADLERATFSNIEHQSIDYVVGTLRRWLVRWEQEIQRKLIPPLERKQQFAEHLIDGLLRGDALARSQALAVQFEHGAISIDEWREIENRNPLPDEAGKTHFVPLNLTPADRVDDVIDAQTRPPAPAPAAPTPAPEASAPEPERTEVVQALVTDLKAEVVRRLGVQDAHAEQLLAAVREVGTGQAALEAQVAAVPAQVLVPPAPPPVDLAPVIEAVRREVQDGVTSVTTVVTARIETPPVEPPVQPEPPPPGMDLETHLAALRDQVLAEVRAAQVAITARLATDDALRGWQDATIAHVTARLVRRELAQVKKLGADAERAPAKLTAFYTRFTADALTELRPWLARFGPNVQETEAQIATLLEEWVAEGRAQIEAALVGATVPDLCRRWEIERPPLLCRRVMEALHGQPV